MMKEVSYPGVSSALPSMVSFPPYQRTISVPTTGKKVEQVM